MAYWLQIDGVNIGSGNGLLPDSTKPLPEPLLTNHQWGSVAFPETNFTECTQDMNSQNEFEKYNDL